MNDRFGHAVGDDVLRHVAVALRDASRDGDLIGRLGGEEFAVVLPGASLDAGRDYAARAAESMRIAPEPVGTLTTSVGLASLGDTTTSTRALLASADEALYAAKAAGRGRAAAWDGCVVVDQPFAAGAV